MTPPKQDRPFGDAPARGRGLPGTVRFPILGRQLMSLAGNFMDVLLIVSMLPLALFLSIFAALKGMDAFDD